MTIVYCPCWCHTHRCVKVPEHTWGQSPQEPLLVALLIACADADALIQSFCALIGPRGQMRLFTGPRLTQGSEEEVVIKTDSRSIFLLPGRPQTAFCWAISVFSIAWFLLFVSPLFAFSASVCCFSPSFLSLSVWPGAHLSFYVPPHSPCAAALSFSLPVSSLFPTAAFRKLSCVKWDRADWLPVLVRARETVKRL